MITLGPSLTGLRGTQITNSIIYTLVNLSLFVSGKVAPCTFICTTQASVSKYPLPRAGELCLEGNLA
jgi:hypothetical protein